jgi:hypothetical protein
MMEEVRLEEGKTGEQRRQNPPNDKSCLAR